MISFEPLRGMFVQLEPRARLDPKWKPHDVALGPADEQPCRSTSWRPASRVLSHAGARGPPVRGGMVHRCSACAVRRLDEYRALKIQSQLSVESPCVELDAQGYDACALSLGQVAVWTAFHCIADGI